ncbi:MAG: Asp-tRNA(Asn)/Glu-tRNA(Gln) amidotransferase subunit GatA [bacterium]
MELWELTIWHARRLLDQREITSLELTRSLLERISSVEEKVRAFLALAGERALDQAREADRRLNSGERTPLLGIPLALKDVLCTRDLPTTCGSRILENFVPPYDATVVERLRKEGAVFLGKTNMDEFAMGSSTEHSAFGPTRNPWDLERIPGGSSGGSAAAVAAQECLGALGSDTGGSIRQPAACCGIVGMKPTYGRVSRYGLVAFASSLDQIGPMTKDVKDCALLLSAIVGHDPRDSTSVPMPPQDYAQGLKGELKDLRVGYLQEEQGVEPDVLEAVRRSLELLETLGARLVPVTIPRLGHALAAYYLVAPAEASSNLARYDGVKYGFRCGEEGGLLEMYRCSRSRGFGKEVKRRIMLGTYALSAGYYEAYYLKACQVRTLLMEDFRRAFELCDVIISPTAPTTAFRLGEKLQDPIQMYLSDYFTIPVNLAGLPALSLPCGLDRKGLPIGLQIIGAHFQEERVLQVAYGFEQAAGYHLSRAQL